MIATPSRSRRRYAEARREQRALDAADPTAVRSAQSGIMKSGAFTAPVISRSHAPGAHRARAGGRRDNRGCPPTVTKPSCCAPTSWVRPTASSRCSAVSTARSARSRRACGAPASRFGARLEPFMVADVQLYQGRTLDIVQQAESLGSYGADIVDDYARYTAANAMVEAADRLTEARGGARSSTCCSSARLRSLSRAASTRRAAPSTPTCCARWRSPGWAPELRRLRALRRAGPHTRSSRSSAAWSASDCAPPGAPRLDAATVGAARRAAGGRLGRRPRPRPSAPRAPGHRRRRRLHPVAPRARPPLAGARRPSSRRRPPDEPVSRTPTGTRSTYRPARLDRASTRPSFPQGAVPEHVAIVMDGNGRWANRTRPHPHRGPQGRGGRAARRRRRRDPGRREAPQRLRVLDRELDALARRGALPHGLQPRRAAPPARPAQRVGRARALGGPQAAAVGDRSSTSCSSPSGSPRGNTTLTLTMCVNYGGRTELVGCRARDRRRRRGRAAQAVRRHREVDPEAPVHARHARRRPVRPRSRGAAHLELPALASRPTPRWSSSTRCGPTSRASTCGRRSRLYLDRDRRFGGAVDAPELPAL